MIQWNKSLEKNKATPCLNSNQSLNTFNSLLHFPGKMCTYVVGHALITLQNSSDNNKLTLLQVVWAQQQSCLVWWYFNYGWELSKSMEPLLLPPYFGGPLCKSRGTLKQWTLLCGLRCITLITQWHSFAN